MGEVHAMTNGDGATATGPRVVAFCLRAAAAAAVVVVVAAEAPVALAVLDPPRPVSKVKWPRCDRDQRRAAKVRRRRTR